MAVAIAVIDLLTETFRDITILAPGEDLRPEDSENGLAKLSRLIDNWNAEKSAVYATRFETFTLVPALQPHTIGPAGSSPTFTVTSRPVSIEDAMLVLNNVTPSVSVPLNLRDAQWWSGLTVPDLSTDIPTDLFYNAEWPLGQIYLWPVPTTAYGLELQTRIVLDDLTIDDTLNLPPGYRDAITLTLGEMLAPSYPPAVPQPAAAAEARARIFRNNDSAPSLATADFGMPRRSSSTRTTFNYRSGLWNP